MDTTIARNMQSLFLPTGSQDTADKNAGAKNFPWILLAWKMKKIDTHNKEVRTLHFSQYAFQDTAK